jgi:hypothetical protein
MTNAAPPASAKTPTIGGSGMLFSLGFPGKLVLEDLPVD